MGGMRQVRSLPAAMMVGRNRLVADLPDLVGDCFITTH
jgi:hypothetical protein